MGVDRVRYAAVGCGGMGRRHVGGMAILQRSAMCNMELVAVCDPNADNAAFLADEAARLLGQRPRVFGDVDAMKRAMPDIEAADVTTDTGSHHKAVLACLEAGLHVLCEKPLAVTLRGCRLLVTAAAQRGLVLSVAENYRRDPINRLIRALLRDGAIGTLRFMLDMSIGGSNQVIITPWRHMREMGSITLDAGVHHADILRYYLGEVRTVYGETRLHEKVRYNTQSAGPGGFYARWSAAFPERIEPTGEDALYAHVTFENGTVAHWVHDHAGHGQRVSRRAVFGSAGSLESPGDRNGRPVVLYRDDGEVIRDERILDLAPSYQLSSLAAELFGGERIWTYQLDFNETDGRILALELFELGECVRGRVTPEVDGWEAMRDVALTYAPFEAGRIGRAVTLAELISGEVDTYQRAIDEQLGLLTA